MNHSKYVWNISSSEGTTSICSANFPQNCETLKWRLQMVNKKKSKSCAINLTAVKALNEVMEVTYRVELKQDTSKIIKQPSLFPVKDTYVYNEGPKTYEIINFECCNNPVSVSYYIRLEITIFASIVLGKSLTSPNLYEKCIPNVVPRDIQSQLLNSVCMDPEFSDVKIKVGTTIFDVHKCILGSASAVFRANLTNDMVEKHSGCIEIKDFQPDVIKKFIDFIYKGQVEIVDFHMATELLRAADIYDIQSLKTVCSKYFVTQLNQDNVIDIIMLADLTNVTGLKEYTINYFCENHKVHGADDFAKLGNRPHLLSAILAKLTEKYAAIRE